jgi:BirA family biotin operon repressor/biotin-[acetyl-CoA-carboxylase] ligase
MNHAAEIVIVRSLLAAGDGFVSGTTLARSLGMSRVAVWQHMEKLRDQGFAFEAVRARGYRLTARPAELNAVLLRAQLAPSVRDFPIEVIDEIDSTNDEASRRLAAGAPAPFALFSRRQTRGRGRFGRTWHSEANGNLYVSFGFRPLLPPTRMQTFTLWMGANLCELLANFCRSAPSLKWPNDLLFSGRKAGGILTEARIDSDQIRDLVLGLGLNLNSSTEAWPDELAARAISLAEQTRAPLDPNRFAAALVGRVHDAYERFVQGTYLETFADLWNRHDLLRGQPVTVIQGEERTSGTAAGIDDEGSLILRTASGQTRRFRAGEVTLGKA